MLTQVQAGVRVSKPTCAGIRFSRPFHLLSRCVLVGLLSAVGTDAFAASLGGGVTSVEFIGTVLTIVLTRAWQADSVAGSLSALAAFFAFAVAAALLIRARGTSGSRARSIDRLPPAMVADCAGARHVLPVSVPPGFGGQGLLEEFRKHFLALHSAWDNGATEVIARLTTPAMLHEFSTAREAASRSSNPSRFLTLDANILLLEERETAQIACVEYHGVVEEAVGEPATPFRELWMLTRSTGESVGGWRLTRHQGLF